MAVAFHVVWDVFGFFVVVAVMLGINKNTVLKSVFTGVFLGLLKARRTKCQRRLRSGAGHLC